MRELALAGLVAVVFGVGSYYATRDFGVFSLANLILGWGALLAALAIGAQRLRFAGGPHARAVILRGLGGVAVVLVLAVGLERAADRSGIRFDLTFEQRFELSPAIVKKLEEIEGKLSATLYHDPLDPRVRRTLGWVETIGRWSMLDVFVVAILVVVIKLSMVSDVEVHTGLYVFVLAVVVSMVAVRRIATLAHRRLEQDGT